MARLHAINWFEIPVLDFDRAKRFYESIFGYAMREQQVGTSRMGFFEYDSNGDGRGGAIVYDPAFYTPCENGVLIYLNCEPDVQDVLNKVVAAGGQIVQGKTSVAAMKDMGYWALIIDSEGNRIALHA